MDEALRWRIIRRGGADYMACVEGLESYPEVAAERLVYWARTAPDRTFLARRNAIGVWERVSFAQALARARIVGGALLRRGLNAERPVAVLSGNSLEHALIALACLYVGVPWCPISPAYAQSSGDLAKLRDVLTLLTPGLLFVDDAAAFARALDLPPAAGVEILAVRADDGRAVTLFTDFEAADPSGEAAADSAFASLDTDNVAKFLLTSGSTGSPKAVINTNRMLCANQQMIAQAIPEIAARPPVLLDWLPWNHTFGGNKIFGLVLHHGGTLYIDDGRPAPGKLEATLANLREVSPTVYFNVPVGYEMLLPHLEDDGDLRRALFADLDLMFYAGAGMARDSRNRLEALASDAAGRPVHMHSGLGATETAPSSLWLHPELKHASDVGMPIPGVELKLAPVGDKIEARVRGPNVTPGYWRSPDLTAAAFDEEGFYRLGDALRFADADDPQRGLVFDGRIAEDFKLSSGTWVSAGPLRAEVIAALKPLAVDVVVAGLNRADVRVLAFPDLDALRALAPGVADAELRGHPDIRAAFAARLAKVGAGKGASGRVQAVLLLTTLPRIDAGELTDKGSISPRGVLRAREADVERLYAPAPEVIFAGA